MVPEDLKYTAEHEWVKPDGNGVARVGITDYAQDSLGDIVFVQLPTVGDKVAAGDTFGEVESTKSVSDLYAPLGGTITARNEKLDSEPELVNSDPYGEGWMVEIQLDDPEAVNALLDAEGYQAAIAGT